MCWDATTDQRMVRYSDLAGGPTIHTAEVCGKDLCEGGVGNRVRCPIVLSMYNILSFLFIRLVI